MENSTVIEIPAHWVKAGQGLPNVCAKHGEPAVAHLKTRFASKASKGAYAIGGAALAAATQKRVTAPAWPYCARCLPLRRAAQISRFAMFGAAVAFFGGYALMRATDNDAFLVVSLIGLVATMVTLLVNSILAKRITAGTIVSPDGHLVLVQDAHPAFDVAGNALILEARRQAGQAV
ncbi:hypothetical protein R8Z50_00260 [Longispora sp. K20-0274]|uniref:hypothetical protein n=1 Tax=Longispora sp. K20-0274 TaxID=3088255 RepID=UPI003999EAC4